MTNRSANRRLVVGLLSALLLALWSFVGYWSWSQRQSVLASSAALLEQLTGAVEEQTARLFKQAETSLVVTRHWMAEHSGEDPGQAPGFIALTDSLRTISEGMLDIRMVNRQGGLFYIPKKSPKPLADVSDRDYFRAQTNPATRGFFIGKPIISRVTGKWGIPVSAPVDLAGGDIGVVFVAVELDRIARAFEAERPKPDGAIAIIRDDGTFLFRVPAGSNIIGQSMAETPSWKDQISKAPRGTYFSDGTAVGTPPKLVSFIRLRDYPLYVTVAAEYEDLLAPWRRETVTLIAVAALVTGASILLAISLLRTMKAEERAQRETMRSHREAQLILASAGEGICGVDARGLVVFMNPAARRILGIKDENPIGANLHALSHHSRPDGSPYPEEDCPVRKTLADGKTREVPGEVFWRADGRQAPVDMVVAAMMEDGVVAGAVAVFHDISERLTANRALAVQAEELARSNSDLEQFAYVASHDLREPLRQISSYVSLLERRYGALLDDDGRDFIAYARDGAKRMNQLVIDLLEFSRVGHASTPPEPTPLSQAVDAAWDNLASRVQETDARLIRKTDLPVILGVKSDLERLFLNLIGNALKYRHPDRAPEVTISARRVAAEWVITVADNGIGIEPEYFERVFGIFQRLHTRDRFDGTGIGLAICKKIVERMGGRVWIDSTPDKGSRFHVALPAEK